MQSLNYFSYFIFYILVCLHFLCLQTQIYRTRIIQEVTKCLNRILEEVAN